MEGKVSEEEPTHCVTVQVSRQNQQQRFFLERLNKHEELSETVQVLEQAVRATGGHQKAYKRSTMTGPFFVGSQQTFLQLKQQQLTQVEAQLEQMEQAMQGLYGMNE